MAAGSRSPVADASSTMRVRLEKVNRYAQDTPWAGFNDGLVEEPSALNGRGWCDRFARPDERYQETPGAVKHGMWVFAVSDSSMKQICRCFSKSYPLLSFRDVRQIIFAVFVLYCAAANVQSPPLTGAAWPSIILHGPARRMMLASDRIGVVRLAERRRVLVVSRPVPIHFPILTVSSIGNIPFRRRRFGCDTRSTSTHTIYTQCTEKYSYEYDQGGYDQASRKPRQGIQ